MCYVLHPTLLICCLSINISACFLHTFLIFLEKWLATQEFYTVLYKNSVHCAKSEVNAQTTAANTFTQDGEHDACTCLCHRHTSTYSWCKPASKHNVWTTNSVWNKMVQRVLHRVLKRQHCFMEHVEPSKNSVSPSQKGKQLQGILTHPLDGRDEVMKHICDRIYNWDVWRLLSESDVFGPG